MGGTGSSLSELGENEFLRRFVGKESIDDTDPFWEQLLSFSFNIPHSSADARLIEESSQNLCKTLGKILIVTVLRDQYNDTCEICSYSIIVMILGRRLKQFES